MNRLDITYSSIFRVVGIVAGIWLFVHLKAILITLLIAVIVMSAMVPAVEFVQNKFRFSHTQAIISVYLITLLLIVTLLILVFPPFVDQLIKFFEGFPVYVQTFSNNLSFLPPDQARAIGNNLNDFLTSQVSSLFGNLVKITLNVFSGFFTFITIAVFTFYLLLERKTIKENLQVFIPFVGKTRLLKLYDQIENKLGAWLRGQLSLSVIIGVTTFVGLNLVNILYSLITGNYDQDFASYTISLSIIAGLLEIIPIIGPILAAVPAILTAFAQDPNLALAILVLYIVIQQAENNLIVPIVMNKSVGLDPLLVLIALLVGGSLLGVVGALIAVPVAAVIQIIYTEYEAFRESEKK